LKLTVNGEDREVSADTLAALLAELDYAGGWLATAVNSTVVRVADRAACRLRDGDRVEILSPRQGG
jgi:sulfur carrier protein